MSRRPPLPVTSALRRLSLPPHRITLFALALALASSPLRAQGSKADYERANSLAARTENTVYRERIKVKWLPDGTRGWYRVATANARHEFVLIDAAAGTRTPLFDHAKLAAALAKTLGLAASADRLQLEQLTVEPGVTPGALTLSFRAGGRRWTADSAQLELTADTRIERTLTLQTGPRAPKRSGRGTDESEITFVNRTSEELNVFWLDREGTRLAYGTLPAGQERSRHTFVTHVFLLTDRAGTTVAVFEATAEPGRAIIEKRDPTIPPAPAPKNSSSEPAAAGTSPNGQWTALIRNYNIHLRNTATGTITPLSQDGTKENAYKASVAWSPDSTQLVAARIHPGVDHQVTFVEAAPRDQIQPKVHTRPYLKPGDSLPKPLLRLFTLADRRQFNVDDALYTNPFTETGDLAVRWASDSRSFQFNYNQRGHQLYRILAVDTPAPTAASPIAPTSPSAPSAPTTPSLSPAPATLTPRIVIEETSTTFVDWTSKTWRYWLDASGEVLWLSERDGWAHLWLYDAKTGTVKNQITRGPWVVREVLHVDPTRRQIWFMAGGVHPGEDPYHPNLCRANFDGTGFTILTAGDGSHRVEFSPDRRWFIDTWSRVDQPPVTELRRSDTGALVRELERAEDRALLAAGWTTPERFVAKGRDGVTDIYGIIVKPSNFDPAKHYPVLEEIYAGPQGAFVPHEFERLPTHHALAELGFIVVQVDGMGTNYRGKKFHEVAWKNLADSGLPDHIAWLRAAATTRPWLDLTRVGIYGGSAGGQSSTRALLDHGDFYRAAVSDCGCHDNRMDKIWWNEQWLGWPVDDSYKRSSNIEDAAKLTGHLLLIVGEMDTNVDPASTMQLSAALIRAGKDFDLLVMPGSDHGAAENPYGRRRRMDFFVRHLLGREPRWE